MWANALKTLDENDENIMVRYRRPAIVVSDSISHTTTENPQRLQDESARVPGKPTGTNFLKTREESRFSAKRF